MKDPVAIMLKLQKTLIESLLEDKNLSLSLEEHTNLRSNLEFANKELNRIQGGKNGN